MTLTLAEETLIETRVLNESKSQGVAFALWFLLALFSAHRFYLSRPISAIFQIISYFFIIGFIWWIVDAFLISNMVRDHQAKTRERLTREYLSKSHGRRSES